MTEHGVHLVAPSDTRDVEMRTKDPQWPTFKLKFTHHSASKFEHGQAQSFGQGTIDIAPHE